MFAYLRLYLTILAVMIPIDLIWLKYIAYNFYQNAFPFWAPEELFYPCLIFYCMYAFAIIILAMRPAFERRSLSHAVGLGALLGIMNYAGYDLTNLALLANWPIDLTIVDICWGGVLTMLATGIPFYLETTFFQKNRSLNQN